MIEILIEYRAILTAVVVALIGLFAAIRAQRISHGLAVKRAIRDNIIAFKSELADGLAATRTNLPFLAAFPESYSFVSDYPRHKVAIERLLTALSERHRRKLQQAWDDYCGKDSGLTPETFLHGYAYPDLTEDFKNRFIALHGCLDDLLA